MSRLHRFITSLFVGFPLFGMALWSGSLSAFSFIETPNGSPLRWQTIPIPYWIGPLCDDLSDEEQITAIEAAIDAWSHALKADELFEYQGRTDLDEPGNDGINVIYCQYSGWEPGSSAIATTHSFATESGVMQGFDLRLNDAGYEFTVSLEPGEVSTDLQNTLTHELGHVLGMGHSNVAEATMFSSTSRGDVQKRDLALDDIAGIGQLYPPGSLVYADDITAGCAACIVEQASGAERGEVGLSLLALGALVVFARSFQRKD